ncbi:MAG: sulfite exporter TauE/SafE family protein [Armatimonadota bacterium]
MTESTAAVLVGLVAMLFAALTQGLTGFGFNLVSVPMMILVLPPEMVVPIVMIYATLMTITIAVEARRWIDVRRIWPLMVAGVVGIPLGVWLLRVLDVNALKVLIGAAIALFGVAFLCGFAVQIKREKLAMGPVGFVSGILAGCTAMSGPPVILFLQNQGVGKQAFRANLAIYFVAIGAASLLAFGGAGLITAPMLRYTLLLLPATVVGGIAGIKLAHRIDEKLFRTIALVVVTIAGLVAVASGLRLF